MGHWTTYPLLHAPVRTCRSKIPAALRSAVHRHENRIRITADVTTAHVAEDVIVLPAPPAIQATQDTVEIHI